MAVSGPVITRVEGVPYRLPLRGTLAWGKHSRLTAAEHVLVRVHLADGTVGVAEAPPRPTIYGETVASILGLLAHLSPNLIGMGIDDQGALGGVLNSVVNNHTARGALDMALWDARAQASGRTLMDVLRGPRDRVRVSFILGIAAPDAMLREAAEVVRAGVRCLKVKVGRDHARDLQVIQALRAEFGDDVQLYADSNETLTPEGAPAALAAMRDAGLLYVEEPLPARNLRARADLHARGLLPIIADDSAFTPADLERELEFDTFDVLNVKTARTGFTDSLAMMHAAGVAGKGVMIGSQASTGVGTIHAALLASHDVVTEPSELSFPLKLSADLLNEDLVFRDGWLALRDLEGLRVDPERLERARL
ncbi:enolase C-terminal domain-like protein [Deinococcus maricopensis]|uniref:Mandelate racemase/muconate lactonizing protein n=1 Tax=Deinococcus maricopensis (strain DSM 21211 / LMG 22137 / NRRL B-23946 / LB-34) TaxID=709986 RepID=E8U8M2_DEIML|nr:enolase C-terminal domain-like protein [Deinococcus maricopensis]ADV67411.1 Mandelate racemase/muconate lactonizing protein [Deinococcus maricopensis DSM 21211]